MSEAVTKKPRSHEKKKDDSSMGRLTLTLGAICAVCALVLGGVYMLTADAIKMNQLGDKMTAMQLVLASDDYEEVDYTGADAAILSAYKAGDAGYVIEVDCAANSFSGTLSLMVGVNADGTVSGVEVLDSAETSGLGAVAKEDASWRAQYVGKSGTVKVDKDGGEITSISGATITSRGVSAGVTAALAAAAELN
ncbi:FMN-binding protein [Vermiculatibacterium agrestimuris]|uniref:FMN-binding protein n=1 Tax=Vermiculatibacterium agrestimuris TaxID=2941519 RepID=UPI00203D13C8|nr:FMN-binding protein [Vermiculatibacterium agrestimuris]